MELKMRAQHLWILGEHLPVKVNAALGDVADARSAPEGGGQPHELLLHINLPRLFFFYSDEQEGRKRFIRRAPISHGGRCTRASLM